MRVHTLPFNITAVILGVFFISSFCSAQGLPTLAGVMTRLSLISEVSSKSVPNSSFAREPSARGAARNAYRWNSAAELSPPNSPTIFLNSPPPR
jgi:hypothetical protein